MKTIFTNHVTVILLAVMLHTSVAAQNSVLVNFGSTICRNDSAPMFSLIKNPLGAAPSLMASCDLKNQLVTYYGVFVAFNPKNNKLYIADIKTGKTRIWILDIGLPGSIACPAQIPVEPNYTYDYVSNNFEFDNNGDLWSFSEYNILTGQCHIDKFDVNTGNIINTRILQFPVGHFPTTILNGDLTITPNGRMFATLGNDFSQLYEITNYNSNTNASANFLQTMPRNCFGIAYLDGNLEVTGFDVTGCYYFNYNIGNNALGPITNFQNGQAPIDNTSFTPALGTTKRITSANKVNATTADIVYEIYVKNMGNVILKNINITDDLGVAFGAANVSNVSAVFSAGANAAGLQLNPLYNGTTVTKLLLPDQQLPNQNATNNDYYFKVEISCRVSNINPNTIYYNSAIGTATINNSVDPIYVSDSSNNGTKDVVDPNNDGNASGVNENIPTPFNLSLLPVHFLNVNAALRENSSAVITWKVATPVDNALNFELQFSADGIKWNTLSQRQITDHNRANYEYQHVNIPDGNLYYRIKQTDINGQYIYSRVVLLQRKSTAITYRVYPNPANQSISISAPYTASGNTTIIIYDATGRNVFSTSMTTSSMQITTGHLPIGTYLLKMMNNNQTSTEKILIRH